jgi:hypothetical protein
MHHRTINLDRAGAISAGPEVTADRTNELLYAVESQYPDPRRIVVAAMPNSKP